jgi:hypothetical protein
LPLILFYFLKPINLNFKNPLKKNLRGKKIEKKEEGAPAPNKLIWY